MPVWTPAFFGSAAGSSGFIVEDSVWFDGSDDSLSRSFPSAGTEETWTFSCWVKRLSFGANQTIFGGLTSNKGYIRFDSSDRLEALNETSDGARNNHRIKNSVYRDPSRFHFVYKNDTTQSTAGDRFKIYVNGSQLTDFYGTANLNEDEAGLFNTAAVHYFGRNSSAEFASVILAEAIFTDGVANDPTAFGEYSSDTGIWIPKEFSGSYGSTGFKLNFSNASSLGADTSGNGNNFTVNGSMATTQQVPDSPTNDANNDIGNYCILNPLAQEGGTLSGGNLTYDVGGGQNYVMGSIAVSSGKWYWEYILTKTGFTGGIADPQLAGTTINNGWGANPGAGYSASDGSYGQSRVNNGTPADYATHGTSGSDRPAAGSRMQIKLNLDDNEISFGNNNTYGSALPISAGTYVPLFGRNGGDTEDDGTAVFDASDWSYSAPTGFKALNTANLAEPTITDPSAYFGTILYSGNSTSDTDRTGLADASGAAWTPDFAWLKGRTGGTATHKLYDSVRGAGNEINPDSTNAQSTFTAGMSAFISGGITVGNGTTGYNESGRTFAVWCLKAGGAPTATNSAGQTPTSNSKFKGGVADNTAYASAGIYPLKASIASHGGFSILQYTGTGSAATIPHGLDSAPSCIIIKETNSSSYGWQVYFESVGNTGSLSLDASDAVSTDTSYWNDTSPTSTLFTVGDSVATNKASSTYIAYCFAKTPGLIGIGSYVGNGSADGPVVISDEGASGCKPAFILGKQTNAGGQPWWIIDNARQTFNSTNGNMLFPNTSAVEANNSGNAIDFLATGFKLRSADTHLNASGSTYVYLAFADTPFALNNRAR